MKSKVYVLFAAFWMCCAGQTDLAAQTEDFVSRHYTMRDGLPDDGINSIMQDSHGFLWFGTYSGLCKFDGYNFTVYRNNPASANSLGNNIVGGVWEDKEGRLWIGHNAGLDVFDVATERFVLHWSDTVNHFRPSTLYERKDGNLLISTWRGIYLAEPKTLTIKKLDQFPTLLYHDVLETDDGSIWAASTSGLFHFDPETGNVTRYLSDPADPKSLATNFSFSANVDSRRRIWIGTMTGLDLFDSQDESFTHYFPNLRIHDIIENSDGRLWIASVKGLYLFNIETGKYSKVIEGSGFINCVFKDNQGNLWVGTNRGLHQLTGTSKNFSIYRPFQKVIGFICEDAKDNVWVFAGGDARSLIKFDPNLKNAYVYPKTFPLALKSIFTDSQGSIWLASTGRLEKFDPNNENFFSMSIPSDKEPISTFMDSRGTIWMGGWNNLNKYDPGKQAFERLTSFPGSTVYTFLEDTHGNLWIGSSSGLMRYRLETGKLDVFKNNPADPESLANNIVFSLTMDSDSTIWVGTGGGLNKMIKGTGNDMPKFVNWRAMRSGLPNDDVYSIVDGGDGTLWLACGNMISHFYPEQNIFRNYDHNDGLSGKNFRGRGHLNGNGLRTVSGMISFGSSDGLVFFHPDSLLDNPYIPPVIITNFSIHDKPVSVKNTESDTAGTPLEKVISYTNDVQLEYHQNDFTFEFAALNYVNPERNQYRYKLEPYEKEWITTNASNRFARYTNISPGTYTFRVIGSNNDGVWNEEGTSLVIVITPPWWQTWWAYSLYSLAFIGMFLCWRSYENKRLILKHRAEHLSELDNLKSRFFANISHEFRTPITLILGPLKKFYNKASAKDEREEFGTMMRNGQRLLRLINQLLDLSKIEAGKMKLQTTPVDLVEFLKEIASSYESLATDKKIKFFFYAEVQELPVYIDQEKIEKVVHNLLSNAFKFTKEGGEVILNLKAEDKQCLVIVKDTGIGISANQLDKVFDRFYQVDNSQTRGYEGSGLGMALAKELVELHHGTISVESAEGKGTTFTVRLPPGKEHFRKEEITDAEVLKKTKMVSDVIISEDSGIEITVEKETVASESQPVLLIVEDNMDMRHFIRKILSDQYQILEAENGKTGIKLAAESVPDLIISDIMMPEMDGYKLCELIKTNELTSHIPVILLTAKADRESKLSGLEIGADDYLSKPFDADELKLIARNHIEERRRMRERFSREITLEPKQISITSLDEKFLTKVLAIIEDHIDDENFSIDALSREAGYSNMHFYRKVKALSGQTPSQFLRTIRLKRAAELLSKNSDNVTQIAYSVGFSSLSYFNKCFKEQFGVTPGQFAEGGLKSKV